ncbi:hypothetical protein [Moritella sp. Urea-trap-13]|uniref:hypothetical protein n=1 Tax=Moritella sp. Urea-trap-13 TaxID=2058327 RepID=UPI000C33FCCC|nr:hypothetical protein [Moritella sp. Urea-trap-13]PKH06556.1 hypothetical protein CXF93_11660 [Moritella sp. Urea-trap-13]
MNRLLLWTAICVFLSSCTNWPSEGYFENTTIHTEERIQFKQHYDYLNLHFSVANLRGAKTCTPAYVKTVENINSRVEKAIFVEDPQDIKVEIAILEKNITNLIVYLNRISSHTNCAQPPRLLTANFVHPLIYQLDLLLYCSPQFEVGSAILTEEYKVCLRQVSFLLLDNPDIVIEYTKYQLFENSASAKVGQSNINYSKAIVTHNVTTVVVKTSEIMAVTDNRRDDDYNEIMRQYLLFDQVPSVNVQQVSRLQLNIEKEHTPVQIHETVTANESLRNTNQLAENDYATSLDDVELLNLRTDVILNYVSSITADPQRYKVIYEDLRLGTVTSLTPVISTLMWQSQGNKDADHKVKHWRFLLSEGELFSDAALPKGVAL